MPKPATEKESLSALSDELLVLNKTLAPFWPAFNRAKEIKDAMRASCEDWPPTKKGVITGTRSQTFIGPCGNEKSVNLLKLLSRISIKAFSKFGSCTIKALSENVEPGIAAEVVESYQTGYRPLKTVALNPKT